jgi:hypothetical protein
MKHAIVKSRPDWATLNEQWARSGLSKKEFCRQQSLPYQTFLKGCRRCIQVGTAAIENETGFAEFIPVNIAPAPRAATPEIVVELPMGVTIRFRGVQVS